ncbi:LPS export ABC transporter permease LptG [Actimicrobium sp. CCC2.4]|uniref:LPS export ABC transporter permease LptG n=1 Tax=Actimicrobium sp. CCC2.4 TaxID=3048606 RepID=UPI002AC93145|nr:LPS export ABC transporter permease LptG [Actimicrobium sp. CCC2.4]MEB0137079.1 LPS export ABC transporter permease LptG [Actimicrobium sp. CCC2.4]WPX33663.1 LPS export ABC transporter permease LptG [Actimicrobium sp. CCC2.4]
MTVLQKYFGKEILRAVLFVLLAFLALFAFFDLINELPAVGRGGYQIQHAFFYIALGLPGYTYELMPIAALIGSIYVLAQMASNSEFTIMRVSGLSTRQAGFMLAKIGLIFVLITFLFGEVISPLTAERAERLKQQAQGTSSKEFRSGLWTKDQIRDDSGAMIGSRFVNVGELLPNGRLKDVKLYEFDSELRLTSMVTASTADFQGDRRWLLSDVATTRFALTVFNLAVLPDATSGIATTTAPTRELMSDITPDILSVTFADPDRMSAFDLATYTRHLAENRQVTERYDIAFWKKIIYPFAVFVMMALALPFAYLHARSGGVSLKIFMGIMIGVSFKLINSLFSHVGLLNTWPPLATAIAPSLLFLAGAVVALWWVERH